jgi:MFS transporter, DHA3 family, macrolide efflux protein
MRAILRERPLRLVFVANVISMFGSGMNTAAVYWYLLQVTHSEITLGKLLVLQTIPGILLLPFSGVVIDREDRRYLVMFLDFARGAVILAVAILAVMGRVQAWHLYAMMTVVAAGFWLFWPTINALIQELTPGAEYVHSNTLLLASVQGGWLIAGAVVGFLYDHIGLGWILVIDAATYAVSITLYFAVRKGKHVVAPQTSTGTAILESPVRRFFQELREGVAYVRSHPYLMLVGTAMALFVSAMLTQSVITAPLSDRILKAGAIGYGWLNGGWGVGAFFSVLYSPQVIRRLRHHRASGLSLAVLAGCLFVLPFSQALPIAVLVYTVMGSARGVGGTALGSDMMELVPKHFMGRVQNTFYFAGNIAQIGLGMGVALVAHRVSLTLAIILVGMIYLVACVTAMWPVDGRRVLATSVAEAD